MSDPRLSELIRKYQLTSPCLHDPNPECAFCHGTGERDIKSRPGEKTFCICLFVDHSVSDEIGQSLGQFATKQLDRLNDKPNGDSK